MHQEPRRGVFDRPSKAASRTLPAEIEEALRRGDFRLVYQPIVNLRTGLVESMEALIRWQHPDFGSISPAEFIPSAEAAGLITYIDQWVLRQACQEQSRWEQTNPVTAPRIHVNLSPLQFQEDDCPLLVQSVLRETGVKPSSLVLEITESSLVSDMETTVTTMLQLKSIGTSLAIDDFGQGYSSLAYIKEFPVDCIKVDQAFTAGLGKNPKDDAIVHAIVTLGRSLGLQVVAEGVETTGQRDILHHLGCTAGQGYLFARPLTSDQAMRMVQSQSLAATPTSRFRLGR